MGDETGRTEEELSDFDYVRFTFPDIHGISRSILTAQRNVPDYIKDGMYITNALDLIGPRTQMRFIGGEKEKKGFPNGLCKPRPGTVYPIPWKEGDIKLGEILCDIHTMEGNPFEACSVQVAKRQIQRLSDKGYRLLSAFETEFTLLNSDETPAFEGIDSFSTLVQSGIEEFLFTLDRELAVSGIELERMHSEIGPGLVEFSMKPQWAIKGADNYFFAKEASKEIARLKGYIASYMTKRSEEFSSNSAHLNHSLWNQKGENVFANSEDSQGLSDIARHWIAGLCSHARAIDVFCAPTVNCYRWKTEFLVAKYANWGFDRRDSAFRVKNFGKLKVAVENRLPTSANNPYLALAATIAAGLDGIERELPIPLETTDGTDSVPLPNTLQEALSALKDDKVIRNAMGSYFVDTFIANKEMEVKDFPNFHPQNYNPDSFRKEIEQYKLI